MGSLAVKFGQDPHLRFAQVVITSVDDGPFRAMRHCYEKGHLQFVAAA
jgi:hypothetical protein